ncbi:MAG TPA: hypothetical protein DCE56_36545 [Cyanobacteria bacterium UBA8553]|nr:hypothetical protein [Cyanobacteria bacterium UBA8553]HAJ58230.1 hypothetical protein [Cyanobacteria bacterium UBA8543]
MDPITVITIIGGIIGIIAGSVQVLDYVEKRREKQSAIQLVQDTKPTQNNLIASPHLGKPEAGMPTQPSLQDATLRQDWGEAVDVSVFYGRVEELAKLEQCQAQKAVLKTLGAVEI